MLQGIQSLKLAGKSFVSVHQGTFSFYHLDRSLVSLIRWNLKFFYLDNHPHHLSTQSALLGSDKNKWIKFRG